MTFRYHNSILLIIFLILLFVPVDVAAQSPLTVDVDRTTISTDEAVNLTIAIRGEFTSLPEPDLSGLQDFNIVGRSRSQQVVIIQGSQSVQGIYNYTLQPTREGELIIPPFSFTIDGQLFETDPIQISVSAGATVPAAPTPESPAAVTPGQLTGQDLFVEAVVDTPNPYLGQQILYTVRFYEAVDSIGNLRARVNYEPPAFTDFWSQSLTRQEYASQAANRVYAVTELRTALFPSGLNETVIQPARWIIPGLLLNPDIVLETDPIAINVRSLPTDGQPPSFNGAVGQFELRASVDTIETVVNEPIELRIEISGKGNIEALTEPELPQLAFWRFFDSETDTSLDPREDGLYGVRRFERLMVPGQAGEFTIPSFIFSYYDPDVGEYQTSTTDPIQVRVLPGDDTVDPIVEPGAEVVVDILDIKPVPAASLTGSRFFSLANPLYWICWILPLFIVATVWVFQTQRKRLSTDVGYARGLRAKRIADRILQEREQLGLDQYAASRKALLGYLSDRLNRPTTGLTTNNLVKMLKEEKLDPILIKRIRATLIDIETSRYAPIEQDVAQSLMADTQQLIDDLEKFLGKR